MSSPTPSICVVVGFSCTNHLRRVSSGASRSPSHKRPTGIMLPPFPYLSLRLLASLPALLASFCLILFPYFLNLDTKPGSLHSVVSLLRSSRPPLCPTSFHRFVFIWFVLAHVLFHLRFDCDFDFVCDFEVFSALVALLRRLSLSVACYSSLSWSCCV